MTVLLITIGVVIVGAAAANWQRTKHRRSSAQSIKLTDKRYAELIAEQRRQNER